MKPKALGLLSGGLDSRLAIKLLLEQGIDIEAIHFKLPFEGCCLPDCAFKFAQLEGIKLHIVNVRKGKVFEEFINILRKPKFGYGSGINPCIDCRIFMLRKAKTYARRIGAKFIFTGEVVGERPMSQNRKAMEIVEKESGLEGKLLRPLSAKLLPETEAEKRGWVDREKLVDIKGRSRKKQLALAKVFGLKDFPWPAGGCLLCEQELAKKLRDLFRHKKSTELKDIELLKIGRHFRVSDSKIIVGRNEKENAMLKELKAREDYIFEVQCAGSPLTILQGNKTKEAIETAAKLTARYSDASGRNILVKYGKSRFSKEIVVKPIKKKEIEKIRI